MHEFNQQTRSGKDAADGGNEDGRAMIGVLRSALVRCTVLGPITVNGSPLGSPLERRLLAALLVSRGAPVSVDALADALWGDDPPASVQNTLQSKISRLRRTVGPDHLLRIGGGYTLDLPDGACDADRFDDLVSAADGLGPGDKLSVLDEALDLWSGRAYEDFADEEFARPSAIGLEQRRLTAHDYRLESLIALGRHHDVVEVAEELIAQDPFRESFWAARMQALAGSGRSVEAVRCYAEARTRFIDETGLPPSSGLAALEQAILADDLSDDLASDLASDADPVSVDPTNGRPLPAEQPTEGSAETGESAEHGESADFGSHRRTTSSRSRSPHARPDDVPARRFDAALRVPPLVDRSEPRRLVAGALAKALAGQPRFVAIVGDVGMGKTRLVDVAASSARAAGVRVLSARAVADVFVPLGPIGQIMSAVGLGRPLSAGGTAVDSDPMNGPANSATSSAVLRLLDRLVEEPTIVVLDDLQWVDATTATALELLIAEAESRSGAEPVPLLVLGGHRPLSDDQPAHSALQRLHRHPTADVIELSQLDEAGIAAMILGATGVRPSGATAARFLGQTDGVPLLITTLLDHWVRNQSLLIRAGCIEVAETARPAAPADVDAALRLQWNQADPQMIEAVAMLALCPLLDLLPLTLVADVLGEVLGTEGFKVVALLDQLVELGLLGGVGRLRFPTPRIRSFIKENVSHRERAHLLQRLATELIEVPRLEGDRPIADRYPSLAVHTLREAVAAGATIDGEEILWWALRSAEESLSVGAWSAAVQHLEAAIAHTPTPGETSILADETPVDLALGLAAFRAHDEAKAQQVLAAAATRAAQVGDAHTEGAALSAVNRIAFAYSGASDLPLGPAEATVLLEAYIERSQETSPRLAALASALLAEDAAVRDNLDSAHSHVERARFIAGTMDSTGRAGQESLVSPALAEIDFAAGLTALSALELNTADRLFRTSSRTAAANGDRWVACWGAGRRILPRLLSGDDPGAATAIDQALDLQLPIRLWSELTLTRALQAAHAAATGQWDTALAFTETASLLATRSGYGAGRFVAGPVAAFVLATNGDVAAARDRLEELRSETGVTPWPFLALVELTAGDRERAHSLVSGRLGRLPKTPTLNRLPAIVASAAVGAATKDNLIIETTKPLIDWLHDRGVRRVAGWPALIDRLTEPSADG